MDTAHAHLTRFSLFLFRYKQCRDCGKDKYQPESNRTFCKSCEAKKTTLVDGSTTCVCEKGSYLNPDKNDTCTVCSDDIDCTIGSTLEKIKLKPGAWRENNQSGVIFDCPVIDSCLGGSSTDPYVFAAGYEVLEVLQTRLRCYRTCSYTTVMFDLVFALPHTTHDTRIHPPTHSHTHVCSAMQELEWHILQRRSYRNTVCRLRC